MGHAAERSSRVARPLPAPPASVAQPSSAVPVDADLEAPGADSWLAYNRDYRGQRFSALTQINRSNIRELRPLCLFQLGESGSFEASPVVFKERIYLSTAHGTYAVDARTCKKIWQHDYSPQNEEPLPVNRGVSLYEGKVLRLTPDGWLLALDAVTGKLLWQAQITDTSQGGSWLSAVPVGFNGRIYFGTAGADRDSAGHIYALDANTGRLVWTFNAVPRGKEPGAETWGPGGQGVGGGSSWSTISIDPWERRLYAPVGNPGSDFDGTMRPGANLFTDSVVVLDAETGKLQWYVQQVPHEVHDYDTAAAPLLYEANHRKYMAVASKSGWLYVYDRDTHELVFKREVTTQLNADAVPTPAGVHVCPGILGGVAWNGAALDATGGRLIVPGVDLCGTLRWLPKNDPNYEFGRWKPDATSQGWLRAFDAVTGKPARAVEFPAPMIAGVTTTAAGLAFTGSIDGEFLAIDSATGEVLYRFQTGGAIAGGISTFALDGRQVIAVASGNTSRVSFSTTGAATLILFGLPPIAP